jgi:hypothetical protein
MYHICTVLAVYKSCVSIFRLNYTPTEEPLLPEEGGILQKFEEELEINDFPQQVFR